MASSKTDPPGLAIIGGVNGCGKSTLSTVAARKQLLFGATAVNPDDLTQRVRHQRKDFSLTAANLIGAEQAEKAVWRAIARGESVAVETVLSSDKFVDVVNAARNRG